MQPVDSGRVPDGRRRLRVAIAAAVVVAVGIGGAVWAGTAVDWRGCEASRAQLRLLEIEPILGAAPPGAVVLNRYATPGCEDEDGIGAAGRSYRYGGDRVELVSFYRSALARQGWVLLGESPAPGAGALLCARRQVGGEPASALVGPDLADPTRYDVEVSAGGVGGGRCS